MTQAIEILERHRLFLIEVEREADVQDAIKAVVITVKQQAEEIQRLRELVKRHEDALEYLFNRPFSNIKIDWEQYFLMHRGETYFVKFDTCDGFDCFKSYTPLAAIEAAMKEEK